LNWTFAMVSPVAAVAVAVTLTEEPETVAPAVGEVMVAVGGFAAPPYSRLTGT
jgi:hypothetical protein